MFGYIFRVLLCCAVFTPVLNMYGHNSVFKDVPCPESLREVLAGLYGSQGPIQDFLRHQNENSIQENNWVVASSPKFQKTSLNSGCEMRVRLIPFESGPIISVSLLLPYPVVQINNTLYGTRPEDPPRPYFGFYNLGVEPHLTLWFDGNGDPLGSASNFKRPKLLESLTLLMKNPKDSCHPPSPPFSSVQESTELLLRFKEAFHGALADYFLSAGTELTQEIKSIAKTLVCDMQMSQFSQASPKPTTHSRQRRIPKVQLDDGTKILIEMLNEGLNPFIECFEFSNRFPTYGAFRVPGPFLVTPDTSVHTGYQDVVQKMVPYLKEALQESSVHDKLILALWEALEDLLLVHEATQIPPLSLLTALGKDCPILKISPQ